MTPPAAGERTIDRLRAKLSAALAPDLIEIIDDSHRHAGHAGARPGGESHFRVVIVAPAFAGIGRLARQRLVLDAVADELKAGVHALSITALAPGEPGAQPNTT